MLWRLKSSVYRLIFSTAFQNNNKGSIKDSPHKGQVMQKMFPCHDDSLLDVKMGAMASQITNLTIVYSTVYSGAHKKSKFRVTGLCVGNSPVTDEFPAQMARNAENVSIWWRHHVISLTWCPIHSSSMGPPTQSKIRVQINIIWQRVS